MKKYITSKKAIALICSLALLLSSCAGGGSNNDSNGTNGSNSSNGSGDGQGQSEKVKISFMLPGFQGTELKNEGSDKVIALYEEYTNTEVEWRFENNNTYREIFGLTLMDRDNMPMILTYDKDMTPSIVDAAKKGAFWDLTEYLKDSERFPNLSQANENVLRNVTVDGKVVAIYRGREIGRNGLSYRTDWAEAVGITEEPKTIEDVYEMMYKFTYEDPDGNGINDTYGLELTKYTGPFDIMQTWFGAGNGWVERDGELVPVHLTEEYREALKMFNKMYEEGLVRKDWATVDTATYSEGVKKGEAGIFIDVIDGGKRIWEYFEDNDVRSVVNPDEIATMTLLGEVNNKTQATTGMNGLFLITKDGAKTEQDLINCLTFLDKLCDDEMKLLGDYGLEGDSWVFNDKGEVERTGKVYETGKSPAQGFSQAFPYIPQKPPVNVEISRKIQAIASDEAIAENEKYVVYNPAIGYLVNSDVNAEVGSDIAQTIDDARTQYICGQLDDAGFDAAIKQWRDRGGDKLIEDINALYKADSSK